MKNIQQIMQMGQQMQTRLKEIKQELANKTVSRSSGGGMVTATADGHGRLREVEIDPTVVDSDDVEMLEDLVVAAVSEAQKEAETLHAEEMKKATGGMPLPFDMSDLM